MPIVMKTCEVFQGVQQFLKKQANIFMGHSVISGLECNEEFYVKHTHEQILVKTNIWPVGIFLQLQQHHWARVILACLLFLSRIKNFFIIWVATLHHCHCLKVMVGASTAFAKTTYPCHQVVATTQRMTIYIGWISRVFDRCSVYLSGVNRWHTDKSINFH